jgi:hypothetical protein
MESLLKVKTNFCCRKKRLKEAIFMQNKNGLKQKSLQWNAGNSYNN